MTATPNADTVIPARIVRDGEIGPRLRASSRVSVSAASAPRNAATVGMIATPSVSAATAPTDAPEERPSRYGSARTFRVSACITAPDTANAAPTAAAVSTRVRRISHTIPSRSGDSGDCVPARCATTVCHTSTMPIPVEPIPTASSIDAGRAAAAATYVVMRSPPRARAECREACGAAGIGLSPAPSTTEDAGGTGRRILVLVISNRNPERPVDARCPSPHPRTAPRPRTRGTGS